MKKIITTTTINKPTEALIKFSQFKDWHLVVVGDKKTPHEYYKDINCTYLHPDEQHDSYKHISEHIGWNKTERRNIGYIKAYEMGAEIIATVDDDNIPYNDWGTNVNLNCDLEVDFYENINGFFDPISVTNKSYLWHRGYPIQLVNQRHNNRYLGKKKMKFFVQADLWNGEPDIDAIYRLTHQYPEEDFTVTSQYSSINYAPFNSQNTFIHRSVLKHYMMPVGVGRIQDIWGAYWLQKQTNGNVLFSKPSVYQRRNQHVLLNDYKDEFKTYHLAFDFINGKIDDTILTSIQKGYDLYQSYFTKD